MKYLIVKRKNLQVDGWTYGEWRQYVTFLDDDSAYCVRAAQLPIVTFLLGVLLLTALIPPVALALETPGGVAWERVWWFAFVGFLLIGPQLVQWLTGWRLVVKVSNRMLPDENGSYWRDF